MKKRNYLVVFVLVVFPGLIWAVMLGRSARKASVAPARPHWRDVGAVDETRFIEGKWVVVEGGFGFME